MDESRLLNACLKKLAALTSTPFNSDRLNWIQQLSNLLRSIDEESLFDNLSTNCWRMKKTQVIEKYRLHRRTLALERYRASTACHFTFNVSELHQSSTKQALQLLPYHLATLLSQLRLASNYAEIITVGKQSLKLFPTKYCPCCHLNKPETVTHLLVQCPAFSDSRVEYLADWFNEKFIHRPSLEFLVK